MTKPITQKEWQEQRAILIRHFDYWRQAIIDGDRSYDARDWFEKVLELFEPTEYLREKYKNEHRR